MMTKKETSLKIAKETLSLETLETRNRDSLDFHDIAVWKIQTALEEAYEAGFVAAVAGKKRKEF